MQPPSNTLIAGDFNAWHRLWDPEAPQTRSRGQAIANWAADTGLSYIGEAGQPTHSGGHTIDLAFSNIPFATARVVDKLHPGSDHEAIVTSLSGGHRTTVEQRRPTIADDKLETFSKIVKLGTHNLPALPAYPTEDDLNTAATNLQTALMEAAKAIQTAPRQNSRNAPWWTEECKKAWKTYRQARCSGTAITERNTFHQTVRKEKESYWKRRIDGIQSDRELYQIIQWHKLAPDISAPPLVVDGRVIANTEEKAHALRRLLLERRDSSEDLEEDPLQIPTVCRRRLPWQTEISDEELLAATTQVKSTSPGTDGISVRLLQACWPHIKDRVRELFQASMQQGHFPEPFRTAEVTMLKKQGKKDYTSARSWRPIALLSCLGKGLERLVARRMAITALTHKVLSPQQAGALPGRSATDLAACLTHEIEHALELRGTATMMTLDVQGAFDATLQRRLMLRLIQQGWPQNLAKFAGSFMQDRQASIRLEDTITDPQHVKCGLPQGSPLSPILFMLYIADILLDDTIHRFGYADDICILRTEKTTERNTELLKEDLRSILSWGANNKVTFDPEKAEVMHFTRALKDPDLVNITVPEHNFQIQQTREPAIRWLGIWFDRKLKFTEHVRQRVKSTRKVTAHIHSLANTQRGPPAAALRKAIKTVVIPCLTYGAEAWYEGRSKTRRNTGTALEPTIKTQQEHLLDEMAYVLQPALKAILPVWRTTPTALLYKEAAIPTIRVILDGIQRRLGQRLRSVDQEHPLVSRIARRPFPPGRGYGGLQPLRTRIQRAARLLPAFPRPQLLPKRHRPTPSTLANKGTKEDTAKAFKRWLETVPNNHLIVYSDGSKSPTDAVGWGYAIYRANRKIAEGMGRLGLAEVFDGEAEGARQGLHCARRIDRTAQVHICIDNTSVIHGLQGDAPGSSQKAFLDAQRTIDTTAVQIHWVPGHQGIIGNEEADRLAKAGTELATDPQAEATLSGVSRLRKSKTRDQHAEWWEASLPKIKNYQKIGLTTASLAHPEELNLPRPVLQSLLAARSGHGDFDWYHRRFNHKENEPCSCKGLRTPEHLVFCPKAKLLQAQWPRFKPQARNPKEYWQRLVTSPKDFASFTKTTKFFTDICPHNYRRAPRAPRARDSP
jgi:ribonuclease HI